MRLALRPSLFSDTLGSKIRNDIDLEFDRWNLTKITELVEDHLMTPDLLPQKVAGLLHYMCSKLRILSMNHRNGLISYHQIGNIFLRWLA